jgi:hypothetical protein
LMGSSIKTSLDKMSMEVVEVRNKPRWGELLPPNLRPDKKRIKELEKLRSALKMPHEALAVRIISSPITTRRIQSNSLETLRILNPEASEKELLRMVLVSRYRTPPLIEMTEEEIDQAMESINSFDELCDYIIKLEEEGPSFPDPFGMGKQIDEILAQEESDKKAPADNLIKSLEQTYFDLKKKNPDRDEHWLLANTWLIRYGSSKQAKQKGAEWTKFVAYKDTLQFSILEPPKSIRALALFLVFQELGEQQAIYYVSEFSQIMEPIMPIIESYESRAFADKYKERNPRTWEENQVEDDSSHWSRMLYFLFKGLEPSKEAEEAVEEAWSKSKTKREIEKPGWKGLRLWRY